MILDSYLNEIEKAEAQRFCENKTMMETVRKVLLMGIYYNGTLRPGEPADPLRNFALTMADRELLKEYTDEELGRNLRAKRIAIDLVELGFKELEKLKKVDKSKKDKVNPAI